MSNETIVAPDTVALVKEAVWLLGLVVSEWQSDPMSVQCFDLRTVMRSREVVKALRDQGFVA